MPNNYEPFENFTSRVSVETTYPDKVIDHRTREFYDREYNRNSQKSPPPPRGGKMESVTEVPARKKARAKAKADKTKQDTALEKAVKKDLTNRGL